MENNTDQMMRAAVDAIRVQILAELSAKETKAAAPTRRLLTAAQAGEYLGKTEPAIRMMTYKRQLPCVRDGRSVRYDIRDLDARIEDLRV
jgi:excisionase family DNA binding protein